MRTAAGVIPEVESHIDLSLEFERHGAGALAVAESFPDLIGEGVA